MSIVSTLTRSRVVDRERLLAKLDELDGLPRADGLLGRHVIGAFRVMIDARARVVTLEPIG